MKIQLISSNQQHLWELKCGVCGNPLSQWRVCLQPLLLPGKLWIQLTTIVTIAVLFNWVCTWKQLGDQYWNQRVRRNPHSVRTTYCFQSNVLVLCGHFIPQFHICLILMASGCRTFGIIFCSSQSYQRIILGILSKPCPPRFFQESHVRLNYLETGFKTVCKQIVDEFILSPCSGFTKGFLSFCLLWILNSWTEAHSLRKSHACLKVQNMNTHNK